MASSSATNYGVYLPLPQRLGHYYSDGTAETEPSTLSSSNDLTIENHSLEINIEHTALYICTRTIIKKNLKIYHWKTWIGVTSRVLIGQTTSLSQTYQYHLHLDILDLDQNHQTNHHRVCLTASRQIHHRTLQHRQRYHQGRDHPRRALQPHRRHTSIHLTIKQ